MWLLPTSPGLWKIIGLLTVVFVFYVITVSIFRLTFHPLAKYPGTFFSKVSSWSIFLQTTSGDRHLQQLIEHEKYGPIVRIGPNTLSINTVSALKEIYANRRGNVQKSPWYDIIDASTGDYSTHSEIDRTKHAARRRVLDHAFSDNALRSAETFIVDNVKTFCELMASGSSPASTTGADVEKAGTTWSEAKNMSTWSTYLNYDIMGDLVFGKRFNCMTSEDHRFIPRLLMNGTLFIYSFANLPFSSLLKPVLASGLMAQIGGQMARDERAYVEYASKEMTERIAAEETLRPDADSKSSASQPRKDIAHYLIHATDPQSNTGFTRTQLDADSSLLIAAGADTTSTTLSAALFYLLHNPGTLARLTSEIRTAHPTLASIQNATLSKLPYLRAVIDETLRLAPPVPAHLPRQVVAPGLTISIDDEPHFFPAGTIVGTSAYCIHHNPAYFPDPFSFNPDRWISADATQLALSRSAFTPFSLGTRGCVGKSLAYMELQLSLAMILFSFDIRLADTPTQSTLTSPDPAKAPQHPLRFRKDEYQLKDRFLAERDGPMVEFRPIKI